MAYKKITPLIARFMTSPTLMKLRRFRARMAGKGGKVNFFYQLDDPYSHLAAQKLAALRAAYNSEIDVYMVAQPEDDVAPERVALQDFARKDSADIAPYHALTFTDKGKQPDADLYWLGMRALAACEDPLAMVVEIGAAYWAEDKAALEAFPLASKQAAEALIEQGTALRDKDGHYLGAMFYYESVWFWGVDRLPYLEDMLCKDGQLKQDKTRVSVHMQRPAFMGRPAQRRLTVEFFPSARSPYSYVAMPEVFDLPNHYPINMHVRPVLPMVMRGLPVPTRKGLYILPDTKREADRIGVPFGNICDPVGEPVRRCYSLFPYAKAHGKEKEFLHAFCQLAWSEGEDMGQIAGLKKAIDRAGLEWSEAAVHLDNPAWEEDIEQNRVDLLASGLWGVPSFRLLDEDGKELFASWGRDRIWLLAHKIQDALS